MEIQRVSRQTRRSQIPESKGRSTGSRINEIEELKTHYYDCSSYKQADRYVTTTKAIKEYVGKNYSNGEDIRATLENMEKLHIENHKDPAEDYTDITDDNGNVTTTAVDQVTYLERKVYENEIIAMVKRRYTLRSNLQKAYSHTWTMHRSYEIQAEGIYQVE